MGFLLSTGCASALYAPCEGQYQCQDGLRCINLGGDTGGICTKPCSIVKKRAGYSDAASDDKYYEDGAGASDTIGDAACADGDVNVVSEDDDGPQKVSVQGGDGVVVGVCRVSAEQLASPETDADSVLTGFCAPL